MRRFLTALPLSTVGSAFQAIERADQMLAQEHRNDLEKGLGDLQILVLGKERNLSAAVRSAVHVLTRQSKVAAAIFAVDEF